MSALRRTGTLLVLAWRGVRRRALSSLLTVLSVALGVGLTVAVVTASDSANRSFDALRDASRSYDLLVGPPQGSPLQIVLVTLFHVDEMEGKFPWSSYERLKKDPRVAVAVPYAVGDVFRGHRVVGTTREMFEVLHGADGRPLGADMRGRPFQGSAFEAVVGSLVAASTGLRLGDEFSVTHGIKAGGHEHGERWKVVGVMRPTGTPHDRAVFITLDSFYGIQEHVAAGPAGVQADEGTGDERSLSAVGLRLKSPGLRLGLFYEIRAGRTDVQVAMPEQQVEALRKIVGDLYAAFRGVAWLVLGVVLIGILVSLYNTIQGRRREIAILRALGARPRHVFAVIVLEAVWICLLGGVLGLLVGRGGAHVVAPLLQDAYGIRIDASPRAFDLQVLGYVLLMGLLAGLLPAWQGLRTPVAANLHPTE